MSPRRVDGDDDDVARARERLGACRRPAAQPRRGRGSRPWAASPSKGRFPPAQIPIPFRMQTLRGRPLITPGAEPAEKQYKRHQKTTLAYDFSTQRSEKLLHDRGLHTHGLCAGAPPARRGEKIEMLPRMSAPERLNLFDDVGCDVERTAPSRFGCVLESGRDRGRPARLFL